MKKIKKLFVIIIAVCALFCTAGCSVKDYLETIDSTLNDYMGDVLESGNKESNETETSSSEIEDVESSSPADEDESEDNESDLIMPDNVLDLITTGLTLRAKTELAFEHCTAESAAIRFYMEADSSLYDMVNSNDNLRLGLMVLPLRFWEQVNVENYAYRDWITDTLEFSPLLSAGDIWSKLDSSTYEYIMVLNQITMKNVNTEYAVIPFLGTTDEDGNETYKYGMYESGNYRTNARSVAYLAAQGLNDYALGNQPYTADQVDLMKTYVNASVDKANGLEEITPDNSTYTASVSPTSVTLAVGETAKISVDIAQDVCLPVAYKMYHSGIAMIDDTGKIKGLSSGSTVLAVYIAGVPYMVNVKVAGG